MSITKTFSSNWVSVSLVILVFIGMALTLAGQLGIDFNPTKIVQNTQNSATSNPTSLETIQIVQTGTKAQVIKDQYIRSETIEANGLNIKILDFNKFIYTSTVNQVQEVYCAIGLEIINISNEEVKILPDFDFELVDGSASGGILLTSPLVKSIDTKPELELVQFETVKLATEQSFRKTIPFVCQENPEYQLIVKTTQFMNNPLFKPVNIKLVG